VIMLFTALENVILNFALIPSMGVRGASVATLISAATGFTVGMIASQRLYPVPHRWSRLAGALAATVLGWVGSFAVDDMDVGLAAVLVLKGAIWLAAAISSSLLLLERHDLGLLRDRLQRLRGR
jgi:O-antigen/teichoic acid export membrane protein